MADTGAQKDLWDKLSTLSWIIAAILVPIVIAVVGDWYSSALKAQQTAIEQANAKREWVKIGLGIFQDANTNDQMRQWALQVINQNSDVKLPDTTKEIFVLQGNVLPAPTTSPASTDSGAGTTAGAPTATERTASISKLQTQGLKALLDKNLGEAVKNYDQAFTIWPTFRNVDEIRSLLKSASPADDQQWKALYKKLLTFDLRGVDPEIISALKRAAT